ncbi:hypothetical protein LguiA_018886 [Lonicera macranthoides]
MKRQLESGKISLKRKTIWGVTSAVGDGTAMKRGCMEIEREALLHFKQGLVADNGFLSSWGSGEDKRDCCKWRGVKCSNRTGHVITLQVGRFELLRGAEIELSESSK